MVPDSRGKAGLNEKIQLGSKIKETQSMLSEERPSQESQCQVAPQALWKSDHQRFPRLSGELKARERTGLTQAYVPSSGPRPRAVLPFPLSCVLR